MNQRAACDLKMEIHLLSLGLSVLQKINEEIKQICDSSHESLFQAVPKKQLKSSTVILPADINTKRIWQPVGCLLLSVEETLCHYM